MVGILLVIALVLGGGVSYSAQDALPGEALYVVKTGVNERFESLFTFSNEGEARLAAAVASRRLEEAEELASNAKLSADIQADLESRFENKIEDFDKNIEELKKGKKFETAAEISSNLESSLQAHGRILASLQEKVANDKLVDLIVKVKSRKEDVSKNRSEIEVKIKEEGGASVEAAARGKLTAAENKITEVKKFIEQKKSALGADATTEAEARLKVAENILAEGKTQVDAKAYGDAFMKFQQSARIAQEAKMLVQARVELKVSVDLDGSILIDDDADENDNDEDIDESKVSANIKTDRGNIFLSHDNGEIELSGTLRRGTPCVNWTVETSYSKDLPPSSVTFDIKDKAKGVICIQVIGEPQRIESKIKAATDADITVKIEGEIVFKGKVK